MKSILPGSGIYLMRDVLASGEMTKLGAKNRVYMKNVREIVDVSIAAEQVAWLRCLREIKTQFWGCEPVRRGLRVGTWSATDSGNLGAFREQECLRR